MSHKNNYKVVPLQQRSPEWLEWRRNLIMASDAPIIMGVSKYNKSIESLIREKQGRELPKKINSSMKEGIHREENLLKCFNQLYSTHSPTPVDSHFLFSPCCVQSLQYPYCGASLDGLSLQTSLAVEIKVTNQHNHELAKKGLLPEEFKPQLQHQMLVLNSAHIYYVSYFIPKNTMLILKIDRDESYIQSLLHNYSLFLEKVAHSPPPQQQERESLVHNLVNHYREIEDKIKNLNKQKENIKENILNLIQHKEFLSPSVTIKPVEVKGRVKLSSIKEDHPLYSQLQQFRGPSTITWRFDLYE